MARDSVTVATINGDPSDKSPLMSADQQQYTSIPNGVYDSNPSDSGVSFGSNTLEKSDGSHYVTNQDNEDLAPASKAPTSNVFRRKAEGILGALFSGCFYGANFDPTTILTNTKGNGHSANGLDYVFNQFAGILLTSTCFLLIYTAYTGNKPFVPRRDALVPSIGSGIIWSFAQVSWTVFNTPDYLGMSTAFPVINSGPGLVATLWGVLVYNEIDLQQRVDVLGFKVANLVVLCVGFLLSFSGIGLVVLSRTKL